MAILDKKGIIATFGMQGRVDIELGCGSRKRNPKSVGIDILDFECVDIVGDVYEVLEQIPRESVDSIESIHVFEHIPDLGRLVTETSRVLKVGGTMKVVVPHFSNPYYYSDYTHRVFFGLYTFSYLAKNEILQRKVPNYGREFMLQVTDIKLGFKSSPPFYIRHALKKLIEPIFNINNYMKELYEEMFSSSIPCYEIEYSLVKFARGNLSE
jgi:ubiquinone/menaquinone biosynthesis C-methylase UbiE